MIWIDSDTSGGQKWVGIGFATKRIINKGRQAIVHALGKLNSVAIRLNVTATIAHILIARISSS